MPTYIQIFRLNIIITKKNEINLISFRQAPYENVDKEFHSRVITLPNIKITQLASLHLFRDKSKQF